MKTITRFDLVLSAVEQDAQDRTVLDGTIEGVDYLGGETLEAAKAYMVDEISLVEWDHIVTDVTVEEINKALPAFKVLANASMVEYLIGNPMIKPVRACVLWERKTIQIRLYLEPKC